MVEVCISDPKSGGFECADREGKSYTLPFDQSEDYIAIPPHDFEALLNSCKAK